MCNKLGDNSDGFISAKEFEELKDYRRGKLIRVFAAIRGMTVKRKIDH